MFLQDIRYALRSFVRAPGFSLVIVLVLSLGIGANIATFSVLDALLLRLLPVSDPNSLFRMVGAQRGPADPSTEVSFKVFEKMRERAAPFDDLMAYSSAAERTIRIGNGPEQQLVQQSVSGNYFHVLGIRPAIGRLVSSLDGARPGAEPFAVISYSLWSRQFDRTANILGRKLSFQNQTFEIIGVAPGRFFGVEVGKAVDVWTPVSTAPVENLANDHFAWLQLMGRLRPGVSLAQASAPIAAVLNAFMLEDVRQHAPPGTPRRIIDGFLAGMRIKAIAAGGGVSCLRRAYEQPLKIIMLVVGIVLLLACVSVANLLIAKGSTRQQEIAIRLSLGATPARILRQLATEDLLLGGAAGLFALLLAHWSA